MFNSSDALASSRIHKGDGKKFCYMIYIPTRFVFVGLSFFGIFLAYAYKVVLSVAIVSMARKSGTTNTSLADPKEVCYFNGTLDSSNDDKPGDFNWNESLQANILGGFFYGYVITQLPAGVLSERFGAKWIFGGSMLCASILSLLGPVAANHSAYLFMATRIGQGLAEGVVFPSMNGMISRWMPKMERSRGSTIIFTGAQFGTVVTLPLTGQLCASTWGWPSVFYVLGVAGCVWFVLWALLIHEDPDTHPYISQQEYDYITMDQGQEKSTGKRITPWKSILTSVPVYALVITHFGQNWGFLTILTLLPKYFEKVLKMDIKHNSLWSSLPYLLQAIVAWIASFISDKLRQKQVLRITVIRKINNTIAFIGSAVCLVAVALVSKTCNTSLSIFFFVFMMAMNGCSFSGFNATHVDMAPDFAGTLMGITNSIGNIPGFVAPLVAEHFYGKGDTFTNWSYVFYIAAAVYVFTAVIYLFFSTAQLQEWGINRNGETSHLNNHKNKKNVYSVNNPPIDY